MSTKTATKRRAISVSLTDRQKIKLQELVDSGAILNVSEGVRSAVHQYLQNHVDDTKGPTRQLQPSRSS